MDEFASDLTPRQKSVLAFITDYQRRFSIAPTVREICAHLGLKSPGGIHRILNVLREQGHVSADADKKRSWRSVKPLPGGGVPLIGNIAGGAPIEAVEHFEETLAISPELFGCKQCFRLRVCGDSMTGAHIMDGDIAIIRVQQRVESGQIAAVLVQDVITEASLKIVHSKGNILMLEPANRRYKIMNAAAGHRTLNTDHRTPITNCNSHTSSKLVPDALSGLRRAIEQCFEETKTEPGTGHYFFA